MKFIMMRTCLYRTIINLHVINIRVRVAAALTGLAERAVPSRGAVAGVQTDALASIQTLLEAAG